MAEKSADRGRLVARSSAMLSLDRDAMSSFFEVGSTTVE